MQGNVALVNPDFIDHDLEDFDPTDEGFAITGIKEHGKCYLEKVVMDAAGGDEEQEIDVTSTAIADQLVSYRFPQLTSSTTDLVVHQPSEIWGYDKNKKSLLELLPNVTMTLMRYIFGTRMGQ